MYIFLQENDKLRNLVLKYSQVYCPKVHVFRTGFESLIFYDLSTIIFDLTKILRQFQRSYRRQHYERVLTLYI